MAREFNRTENHPCCYFELFASPFLSLLSFDWQADWLIDSFCLEIAWWIDGLCTHFSPHSRLSLLLSRSLAIKYRISWTPGNDRKNVFVLSTFTRLFDFESVFQFVKIISRNCCKSNYFRVFFHSIERLEVFTCKSLCSWKNLQTKKKQQKSSLNQKKRKRTRKIN